MLKAKKINRYGRRNFTMKYRAEKWLYEDSKKCAKEVACAIGGVVLGAAMFLFLFIFPALLH